MREIWTRGRGIPAAGEQRNQKHLGMRMRPQLWFCQCGKKEVIGIEEVRELGGQTLSNMIN